MPHEGNLKSRERIAGMFNRISSSYDFLNHFFSLGVDHWWRYKAIAALTKERPKTILDVATGTGDLAFAAFRLQPNQIIGIDISEKMLGIAQRKIDKRKGSAIFRVELGDSTQLAFEDDTFEAITVAFGVRNFENLEQGLSEMVRVLKKGGKLVILEFSRPTIWPVAWIYDFYFRVVCPFLGAAISGDRQAYMYLYNSVKVFPQGGDFLGLLDSNGLKETKCATLTFGICSLYTGYKA